MTTPELEALVGHLFVVGGRAISAASPGAVAAPPPRRPARGRERDTFFGLLSLAAGERQPAQFYEAFSDKASSTFFSVGGSVTSALRETIIAVSDGLLEINASRPAPLEVGISYAVLREQEVYIAVSGSARCLIINGDYIERLPQDDELQSGLIGIGKHSEPDVKLYRREIHEGDFLVLADASLNRLTDETLLHAASTGEIDEFLNNLSSVAGDFSAAEIIKFVAPLTEGETDNVPTQRSRPRVPPLPQFGILQGLTPSEETPPADVEEEGKKESPQPQPTAPTTPPGQKAASIGETIQQAGHNIILKLAEAAGGLRTLTERMLPDEDQQNTIAERFQLSITMQIGIVAIVAILVALITTAVYNFRGQTSKYAQLVREAQSEIELARAAGNDQAAARSHWEMAAWLLAQASEIHTPSSDITVLVQESRSNLDSYDHVTRVDPVLLREYAPGTMLRGPVVQGLNVYVIDTTKDILYREDLDEAGSRLVNNEVQVIAQQGDIISNQVVGGLIDLLWIADGGIPQRNVLGILSRNGLLLTYSPSSGVSAVLLPGYEAWVDPRAVAIYDRNLYVLDAGANEIWRYEAGTSDYSSQPLRYFTDFDPQLGTAIDMEIDTNGNMYVLHSTGEISKYFLGRPQPFEFSGLPHPVSRATAFFINLSLFDRTMLIADAERSQLYATALSGTFLANYKANDEPVFSVISGIYSQDRPSAIFVTTGNGLYYFSRP